MSSYSPRPANRPRTVLADLLSEPMRGAFACLSRKWQRGRALTAYGLPPPGSVALMARRNVRYIVFCTVLAPSWMWPTLKEGSHTGRGVPVFSATSGRTWLGPGRSVVRGGAGCGTGPSTPGSVPGGGLGGFPVMVVADAVVGEADVAGASPEGGGLQCW